MPVLSDKRLQQIEFAEAHGMLWESNAALIGLSSSETSAIKTATSDARGSYSAAQLAREASKAATITFYNETNALHDLVSDAIKKIRLFAESTDNPEVFALAQIPVPAAPSPAPPPGQPTDITAIIEPTGALTLKWLATSGSNNGGAVYLVKRKLAGEAAYTIVGAATTTRGYKSFTDSSLPANVNNFQYIIQGQRGSVTGPDSSVFTVTLGGSGPGLVGFSTATVKMAA